MKFLDKLEFFIGGLFTGPFLWLVASWVSVLTHQFSCEPLPFWNFFVIMMRL